MKICACCFADEEVKSFIKDESSEEGVCDFCNKKGALIDIGKFLDFFTQLLAIYIPSKDGVLLSRKIQDDWNLFNDEIVCNTLLDKILPQIDREDLQNEEIRVNYNHDINECVSYWSILKTEIKEKRRFITNTDNLLELGWDTLFPNPISLAIDKKLYRARIHETSTQSKYDATKMGVPPIDKATTGRANPMGIPYLYLCEDIITTLYETRALYLDKVSIGTFSIIGDKPLNIIDLTAKQNVFRSPFTAEDISIMVKSKLLMSQISKDLSKPLRRYDSEVEYVPTQFICEYIRYIYKVDGIKFNSSLHINGINYVIFNHKLLDCINVEEHQITTVEIKSTPQL